MNRDSPGGIAVLTALAMLAFAANSIFCRLALAHTAIDPAAFTLVRIGAGAATLTVLCRIGAARQIAGGWLSAAALLAYAACFSFAYVTLGAGTGALLLFGAVQATMIGSGLVSGERFRLLQWAGFGGALAGLVALLAPGVTAPDPAGAALMIAAGIAWGAYSLLGRGTGDAIGATAGNFVRAAVLALPLLLLARGGVDGAGLLWAALSGAIASALGYAVWYTVLPRLPATLAATVQLSVPVITAFEGAIVLNEPITVRLILSSIAVLAGIGMVVRGRTRPVSPAPQAPAR